MRPSQTSRDIRLAVRELLVADRRVRTSRPGLTERVRATANRSAARAHRTAGGSADRVALR
jgi:hypothetical protein